MNRHDRGFHFRCWTSKTDHYTKSYPDCSLGGDSNSGTQFTRVVNIQKLCKNKLKLIFLEI